MKTQHLIFWRRDILIVLTFALTAGSLPAQRRWIRKYLTTHRVDTIFPFRGIAIYLLESGWFEEGVPFGPLSRMSCHVNRWSGWMAPECMLWPLPDTIHDLTTFKAIDLLSDTWSMVNYLYTFAPTMTVYALSHEECFFDDSSNVPLITVQSDMWLNAEFIFGDVDDQMNQWICGRGFITRIRRWFWYEEAAPMYLVPMEFEVTL